MQALSVLVSDMWLSCDHTFRSVANVGMVRKADRHWVKQYKGLFCVLNSLGQVVTWELTKSLAFDVVEECMQLLDEQLCGQGS